MKILPAISKGIVLMRDDGTFEMAPFQVFRSAAGMSVIRIGNNVLYFDKNGVFDGSECKCPPGIAVGDQFEVALKAAFSEQVGNRGHAPVGNPYFSAHSAGWEREVASWPTAKGVSHKMTTYTHGEPPGETGSGTVH
jgi:hypothetical protein